MRNILLIGYRATGKSTVGRALAQHTGMTFIDMDDYVVAQAGMTVEQMVRQHGWAYFRELEKQALLTVAAEPQQVVATGGGAVLHQEIWPQVRQGALVAWLQADVATICRRLAADDLSSSQRPSLTGSDIQQEVEDVLAERQPLYEASCDVSIDTAQPVAKIVAEIEALWNGNLS